MAVIKPKRHESDMQYVLSAFKIDEECCAYSDWLKSTYGLTFGDVVMYEADALLRYVSEVQILTSDDVTTLTRRLAYIHAAQTRVSMVSCSMNICYQSAFDCARSVMDAGFQRLRKETIMKKTESVFCSLAPYISDIKLSLKRLTQSASARLKKHGRPDVIEVLKTEIAPLIPTYEVEEVERAGVISPIEVNPIYLRNYKPCTPAPNGATSNVGVPKPTTAGVCDNKGAESECCHAQNTQVTPPVDGCNGYMGQSLQCGQPTNTFTQNNLGN